MVILGDGMALSEIFDQNAQLRCEFARRTGFVVSEINEALGLLEDMPKSDVRHFVMKALRRAKEMLQTGETL